MTAAYQMEFEWDPKMAIENLRKHGVAFVEAATVFGDTFGATVSDHDHSASEERFIIIGQSNRNRLLIVSFAERGERIRIISARELTRTERKAYEEKNQN
jgi:uncharacterized DUF497 family protein